MPTTLLRGITGASSRTSASVELARRSAGCRRTAGRRRARRSTQSSSGMPKSSTSPVTTPYWGSSPVVNLAIRTRASLPARAWSARCLPLVPVETRPPLDACSTSRLAARAPRTRRGSTRGCSRTSRAAAHGVTHPVHDFLFTYYSQRPAALRRWHPGYGVALAGRGRSTRARRGTTSSSGRGRGFDPAARGLAARAARVAAPAARRDRVPARPARLLRAARVGDGLPAAPDEVRHATGRCGSGAAGTDEVVESHRITLLALRRVPVLHRRRAGR